MASTSAATARARWELENGVASAGPEDADVEALYRFDPAEQSAMQQQRPWAKDPHFFKRCGGGRGPERGGAGDAAAAPAPLARGAAARRRRAGARCR
jgi:hypothetical protein